MTSCHVVNCYLQGSTDRVMELLYNVQETFKQKIIIHFKPGVMYFLKIVPKYVANRPLIYIHTGVLICP